jgi:hypothetical protein
MCIDLNESYISCKALHLCKMSYLLRIATKLRLSFMGERKEKKKNLTAMHRN